MEIDFKNTKELNCYKDLLEHPSERKFLRKFLKYFPIEIAQECIRRYELLTQYDSAADYNRIYCGTANCIEIKNGTKDKAPLIMKVRISNSWRKFFYAVVNEDDFMLTKEWSGKFETVNSIYIVDVNKHDYNIK